MTPSNLLTVQEVADILKIRKNTVYELIKRGELPTIKIGKQFRIADRDVDRYLKASEIHTGSRQQGETVVIEPSEQNSDKIVLCGQDISLDIIANHISAQPGLPSLLRSHAGSYNSLYALYQGKSQIATAHLWDESTGEYNYAYITRLVPGTPVTVIRLLGRMQGFYIPKGNPKSINAWEDLSRDDLTIAVREKGSGTRILLDEKLKAMSIDKGGLNGYSREYTSHLSVAAAVARGDADFGLGSAHGCQQVGGLEFIPLHKEWYDMVFLTEKEDTKPYKAIVDFVTSEQFLQELKSIGGYDLSETGRIERL